jgi:hypothetical protein
LKYDNNSSFSGSLKYVGGAVTAEGKVLLCGGCLVSTGDPANTAYESHLQKPSKTIRKKSMSNRRYAHATISLNGYVYVLGGYNNKD